MNPWDKVGGPDIYALKFDGARTNGKHWTSIGPEGGIGDYETQFEARDAIEAAAGRSDLLTDGPTQHGCCLLWIVAPGEETP
jgi:hypothetical protein